MNWRYKILITAGAIFIVMQFIQPVHNKSSQILTTDISRIYNVPDSVQKILKNSCYDCHSNNTIYPWYFNIQPAGWLLTNHVKNGKENLNFSEFGSYSTRKQANKLRAISQSVTDGSMPISSYLFVHHDARLTNQQKEVIISWTQIIRDSLMAKH